MFLAEPEIENIVFSDHKYHGDLLNLFTHEDSFFSAGKKKKGYIYCIHFGGKDDIVISGNSLLRSMNFFPS